MRVESTNEGDEIGCGMLGSVACARIVDSVLFGAGREGNDGKGAAATFVTKVSRRMAGAYVPGRYIATLLQS